MHEDMGPLSITQGWNPTDGQYIYQIAWTTEQLQQIEQAIEEGDQGFLTTVEEAIRHALDTVLTPRRRKNSLT